MPTINIGGQRVRVDDGFLSLSPEDQQKTVDEIEASLGGTPPSPPATTAAAATINQPPPTVAAASPSPDMPLSDMGGLPTDVPVLQPPPVERGSRGNVPIGVQSTGAGAAELLAMLPDMAAGAANIPIQGYNALAGLAGGPTTDFRFTAPSEILKRRATTAAEEAGFVVRDPQKLPLPEKLAYNVNRFGVQGAGMIPALARAGVKRTADFLAGEIGHRWYDPLVRPYSGQQPIKTTGIDVAAAGGTGAGVTAADELAPDNPIASLLGGIGGGASGSTLGSALFAIPKTATNLARSLFGMRDTTIPLDPSKPFAEQNALPRGVVEKASEIFQNEAIDPKAAEQRMLQSHSEIAPYMTAVPTSPQLTEDTGLLLLDKELRSRNQAAYNERTRDLNTAARDAVENVVPPDANRADLVSAAQTEAIGQRAAAQSGVENVQQRQQRVENIRQGQGQEYTTTSNPPGPPSAALHQQVVEQSLRPMTAARNQRYEAIPNEPTSARPIVDRANELEFQLEQMPQGFREGIDPGGVLQGLRNLVDDDGNAVDVGLQTLQRMRNQLSEAANNARKANAPGGTNHILADNIETLRNGLADMIDRHPAAAAATTHTREVFSPVWGKQSPTARDFRRRFFSEPDTSSQAPPSQTGSTFIQPNAPEKTAELQRIIQSMPNPAEAQNAARDFLRADLAASGAVDAQGRLNPRAVESWANKNRANLDLVPGFRQEIEGVVDRGRRGVQLSERLTGDLRGAERARDLTEETIRKSALGDVLSTRDPDKVVAKVMSDPYSSGGKLDDLIKLTENNPKARDGLKQSVQDYILDKITTTASEKMRAGDQRGPVSSAKLGKIISEHNEQLAKIFNGPGEMNALRAVHKSLELAKGGLASGQGATEAVTRLHRNVLDEFRGTPVGRGIEAFTRLKFGALTAGGKWAGLQRALHGVGSEQAQQVEALLLRAAMDPDIAKLLLGREIPVGSPKWNKNLTKLLSAGEAARDNAKPDQKEEL